MKFWVVMSNDCPDSVWDSETAAEIYVASKKAINKANTSKDSTRRIIYWRAYQFEINTPTKFGE